MLFRSVSQSRYLNLQRIGSYDTDDGSIVSEPARIIVEAGMVLEGKE